jgi:hypothetical protein
MGGAGSGGARVGSGPKPGDEPVGDSPADDVQMPADLMDEERIEWEEMAPHALAAGTLTQASAGAFRDLCELIAFRRWVLREIRAMGLTEIDVSVDGAGVEHQKREKNKLIAEYRGLMQRVETGRRSFKVAPIGKPMARREQKDKPKSALEKLKAQAGLRAVK